MAVLVVNCQLQEEAPASAAQLLREAPRGAYTAALVLPGVGVCSVLLTAHPHRTTCSYSHTGYHTIAIQEVSERTCLAGAGLGPALRTPGRVAAVAEL